MKVALSIQFFLTLTTALPEYAHRIPNGFAVPNPGPEGGIWAGVGHENPGGGGERNPFGLDFASEGHYWTDNLCLKDSDGDGRSNGEELGDPNCIWFEGEDPEGPAVSHPGIIDEPTETALDSCATYVAPEDEIAWDLVFSRPNSMNEEQTHYICEQMLVDVPSPDYFHKIKSSVVLDNSNNVLHHMFVYLCPDENTTLDGNRIGEGQYECGIENRCERIGGWAVGPHDTCLPPNVGEKLDFTGMEKVIIKIEAHYDNTSGESQQDQSGIRIFLTQQLRAQESSRMVTGMTQADPNFAIPPSQDAHILKNICPTEITEYLSAPVYAYSFYPHMHYHGRSLVTEHYRCGNKIGEVGRIDAYEFDNQQSYIFPVPIKILPGDSLVTICSYDSTEANETIVGGEETDNEMCYNFLSVYPDPKTVESPNLLSVCSSFEDGVTYESSSLPFRFAIGGDQTVLTRTFSSSPNENIGACCDLGCEQMYIAQLDEACAVDSDCNEDLVCVYGLCAEAPVPTPAPTSSSVQIQFHFLTGFMYMMVGSAMAGILIK